MKLIDGKLISQKTKDEVRAKALELSAKGVKPGLAVILVGDDKASQTYVASKEKASIACEIASFIYRLSADTNEETLINLIKDLNSNDQIDGILVQLPLPRHIDENAVLKAIDPRKDVDGFSAVNVGNLVSGLDGFVPCTPLGIMRLFAEYGVDLEGKNALVIGRSNLLLNASATVTIAHSKTKNLAEISRAADIIVVAIGRPNFLRANMVKDGAVVIDVGINRLEDGRLVGDVNFDEVAPKCKLITPVPGGVGPMTIAMLLSNTIKSAQKRLKDSQK